MQFRFAVREWSGYVCQVTTDPLFNTQDDGWFHRLLPALPPGEDQGVVVKILDLPATDEEETIRIAMLGRQPQHGPPALEFMKRQPDGWYLHLPYPHALTDGDDMYEELAILLRWLHLGLGISVEMV